MSKPFRVVFQGSLGTFDRSYAFPTFQKLLEKEESMTIVEVHSDERFQTVYLTDQNGTIHYGIEITKN